MSIPKKTEKIKIWLIFRLKAEPGSTDKYHLASPLLDRDSNWRTGREGTELEFLKTLWGLGTD